MKFILFGALLGLFFIKKNDPVINTITPVVTDSVPSLLKGEFVDDYDIRYTVSDSLFFMHPRAKYHIIKWNIKDQYFIAKNDTINPSEKGLYSRIDYMYFENMAPWGWGFCLTVYDAKTDAQAETQAVADRKNPRKGCNGFPFSRMKPAGNSDGR